MLSLFCSPARYVQGRDATSSLGQQMLATGLAGPAYILASPDIQNRLGAAWKSSLGKSDISYSVDDFGGECTRTEIDRGTSTAKEMNANVVVGVGGGKTLDTARAIAANLGIPVVNCPTLASTDAPCSALSVVYTADGEFEEYLFYPRNPELVLVDTSVIARAPRRFLVSGMGDALATWFEARTVIEAHKANQVHGGTTLSAEALAKLCYETLLADGLTAARDVEVDAVTPALERVVEANTLLSGLGFESGGLAIAHSLHNGLTTAPETHEYMHGEKVAFGLLVQLIVEGRPATELAEVTRFCRSVGLPTTLAQLGLSADQQQALWQVAQRTVQTGETAHNEPFPVTADLIYDGILAANHHGETFGSAD